MRSRANTRLRAAIRLPARRSQTIESCHIARALALRKRITHPPPPAAAAAANSARPTHKQRRRVRPVCRQGGRARARDHERQAGGLHRRARRRDGEAAQDAGAAVVVVFCVLCCVVCVRWRQVCSLLLSLSCLLNALYFAHRRRTGRPSWRPSTP